MIVEKFIIDEFKSKNVYELVEYDIKEIEEDIVEYPKFREPEIDYDKVVTDRLNVYLEELTAHKDQKIDLLKQWGELQPDEPNHLSRKHVNAKIQEIRFDFADKEREYHSGKVEDNLIKTYNDQFSARDIRKKNHETKIASCLEVFSKTLGATAKSTIQPYLDKNQFKKAWYNLRKMNSAAKSGDLGLTIIQQKIQNEVYNGCHPSDHVNYMERLRELCTRLDNPITDSMFATHLQQSMERGQAQGEKGDFSDPFKFHGAVYGTLDLGRLKDALHYKATQMENDWRKLRESNRVNNITENDTNSTSYVHDNLDLYTRNGQNKGSLPECPHCNRHHKGTCRLLTITCYKCGKQGHKANQCGESKSYNYKKRNNDNASVSSKGSHNSRNSKGSNRSKNSDHKKKRFSSSNQNKSGSSSNQVKKLTPMFQGTYGSK